MAKKIQVRTPKVPLLLNCFVGALFVLLGIFVVIPSAGVFGIVWTLVAAAILANGLYHLLSKRGGATSEIYITDTDEEEEEARPRLRSSRDTEERLTALRDLYDRRVITHEEYEAKRAEILKEL